MSAMTRQAMEPSRVAETRWSVVLQAGCSETSLRLDALETLCRAYWYPLYCYARRMGSPPEDAQDLTQSFFAFFLEKNAVSKADRRRGRFRTFLLSSFRNFLTNEWKRERTARRGGGWQALPLDRDSIEARYAGEGDGAEAPGTAYDRIWATSILKQAMARLQEEYASAGKGPLYAALKLRLWGDHEGGSHTEVAEQLGLSEAAVKMAVMRLRRRFRQALRYEIAQTLAMPAEVDEEMRYLLSLLRA